MQKWEYMYIGANGDEVISLNGQKIQKREKASLPRILNDLGDQGWELVNSFLGETSTGFDLAYYWTFVFKRSKD
jgi:hypothetical protein